MKNNKFYRFQELESGWYLREDREGTTPEWSEAGLFTLAEWEDWGKWCDDMRLVEPTATEQMLSSGADVFLGFGAPEPKACK